MFGLRYQAKQFYKAGGRAHALIEQRAFLAFSTGMGHKTTPNFDPSTLLPKRSCGASSWDNCRPQHTASITFNGRVMVPVHYFDTTQYTPQTLLLRFEPLTRAK